MAFCLTTLICCPGGAFAEELTPADDTWRARHERGIELYERGDYTQAAEEFERAQGLGAPAPNLYNLARTYEHLERIGEAIDTYDEYLSLQDIPPDRRAQAEAHRARLTALPGVLEVRSSPEGASILCDDEPWPEVTPATLSLAPGEHRVTLTLDGSRSEERRLTIVPGGHQALEVLLEATPPQDVVLVTPGPNTDVDEPASWSGGPWVLMGLGIAVALGGGALDIAAYARSEGATQFGSIRDYEGWYDSVGAMAIAGDVMIGLGVAVALAGLIWKLVERRRARSNRPAPSLRSRARGLAVSL